MKFRYLKKIKLLFLYLIIINKFFINYSIEFCIKCINKYVKKCNFCSKEIIFDGLNIASKEETLNEIIYNNKSIARFGDGEFNIMFGWRNGFQDENIFLKNRLINTLNSNLENLLIGLHIPYHQQDLKHFTNSAIDYLKKWFTSVKFKLVKLINKNKKYYNALISRFYTLYKDKKKLNISNYIKKLKKIWDKKDILIIEGYFTRNGIGNDLFNNAKSIKRILCPPKNAFFVYDKIINEVKKLRIVYKNLLILISLGPTASILAYDLCKLGFQAIDIGHADLEYEYYLRKYDYVRKIPYKYVNEIKNGSENITNITDKNYYQQIICKILH